MTPWTFNKNYRDHAQVAQFWDAYEARFLEITGEGGYPYNADFREHLGAEFASQSDEDSAIYLLQSERHEREDASRVFRAASEGCVELDQEITETPVKFARIVHLSGKVLVSS